MLKEVAGKVMLLRHLKTRITYHMCRIARAPSFLYVFSLACILRGVNGEECEGGDVPMRSISGGYRIHG